MIRELLVAYPGVRHFWYCLDSCKFHIFTDHKMLTTECRILDIQAELTSDVCHIAGKASVVDDALSQPLQQPLHITQPCRGLLKAEMCGQQPLIIRLGLQPRPLHGWRRQQLRSVWRIA